METRSLPVPLTIPELIQKGHELAEQVLAYGDLQDEKKRLAKNLADDITEMWEKVKATRKIIETGQEYRPVPIYETKNFANHTVETYRQDTDALVSSRPMTEKEQQTELFSSLKDVSIESA